MTMPEDGRSAETLARLNAALADRYRIERHLGGGGMADVYLARDLRHDRLVAVKVLRPEFSAQLGAGRFLDEIRTTANLQHPHIVTLHDSGEANGLVYYVMTHVEGESLRDRLRREGQLPVREAVRIAREVADALDYAHRRGIVHRDVKPENILLNERRVLVADFGIALAASRSESDTRLTATGVGVGTPQYMSPEQMVGERNVDGRADVYALAAVLYEMLAGQPPFPAANAQAIMARALTERPTPIRRLRDTVPESVEQALQVALQKLPADRFSSAAEFAAALDGASAVAPPSSARRRPLFGGRAAVAAGLVLAGAAIAWIATQNKSQSPPSAATARAVIPLGPGEMLDITARQRALDISPDGTQLVYVSERAGTRQLYVRPIGDFSERALSGTANPLAPVFSPDGRWIAYFAGDRLFKIELDGGAPIPLATVKGNPAGASWSSDGSIFYCSGGRVYRVADRGGVPAEVVLRVVGDTTSSVVARVADWPQWPQVLPDNKHALIAFKGNVGVVDIGSGDFQPLFRGAQARYVSSGHIVFDESEGRVRVVPFDLRRRKVTGNAVRAFEAFRGPGSGAAYFAVSRTGTLVYVPGSYQRTLVTVDKTGRETAVPAEARGYRFPRISPNGKQAAVTIDPRPSSIWVVDLERGSSFRVSADSASTGAILPVWSPDGKRLGFTQNGISLSNAQPGATVARERVPLSEVTIASWIDERRLLIWAGYNSADILTFTLGDSVVQPLVVTSADERQARLSPDGRWFAFMSNLSGTAEVYVRPFPGPGANALVSSGGGREPRWSARGDEIFYRQGFQIMSAKVRTTPTFEVLGTPQLLFDGPYDFTQSDNWDVGPDGRFLMIKADPAAGTQILVVFNWLEELKRTRQQ